MIDEMDAKRRAREFIDRTGRASAYRDGKWAEIRRSAALEQQKEIKEDEVSMNLSQASSGSCSHSYLALCT